MRRVPSHQSANPNQDYQIPDSPVNYNPGIPADVSIHPQRPGNQVIPYRGQEYHGVAPTGEPDNLAEDEWNQNNVPIHGQDEHEPVIRPVPVRIVSQDSDYESIVTRTFQISPNGAPTRIVGRDIGRKRVLIKNTGTVDLWVSAEDFPNVVNSYVINANGSESFNGTNSLWCVSSDGSNQVAAVLVERSVSYARDPQT